MIFNENVEEENTPKLAPKMIKSRSFKRYKTVSLGLTKKAKSDHQKDEISSNNQRGRARSKSIDDRDGNIRRKRVHKTPPPPPRPQKRPKKYSMNDVDDVDLSMRSGHHCQRSQTIDLKQYINPNEFNGFKPPKQQQQQKTKSVRISDELFSRDRRKKKKKKPKKIKKKKIPKHINVKQQKEKKSEEQ